MTGAQFEILVDGKPRSYRDIKAVAIGSPVKVAGADATERAAKGKAPKAGRSK